MLDYERLVKSFMDLDTMYKLEDPEAQVYHDFCLNKLQLACIQKLIKDRVLLTKKPYSLPVWQDSSTYYNHQACKQAMRDAMEGIYRAYGWEIMRYNIEYSCYDTEEDFQEKLLIEGAAEGLVNKILDTDIPLHLIMAAGEYAADTIILLTNDAVSSYKEKNSSIKVNALISKVTSLFLEAYQDTDEFCHQGKYYYITNTSERFDEYEGCRIIMDEFLYSLHNVFHVKELCEMLHYDTINTGLAPIHDNI